MIKKLTPENIIALRKKDMIIKWRASGRNGTVIKNPSIREVLDKPLYQKVCQDYVHKMLSSIIYVESRTYEELQLKCAEYYYRRYDVTAIECKILRNEILNKLKV